MDLNSKSNHKLRGFLKNEESFAYIFGTLTCGEIQAEQKNIHLHTLAIRLAVSRWLIRVLLRPSNKK